jgi:hypothetical protein
MIIHKVYDIGVAYGKDHPDTPCALNGLNLHHYPASAIYIFEQDPFSDGSTGFVVWKQVNNLGDHSLFHGLNYPIIVNLKICECQAPDGTLVPFMQKNCVYTSYRRFRKTVSPHIMRFNLQASEDELVVAISLPRDGWNCVRQVSIWSKPSVDVEHWLRSLGVYTEPWILLVFCWTD